MKDKVFILLFLILFLPFVVKAEDKYLYDVLKDEATSNGLARQYNGPHKDSFTEEASKNIYHWYAVEEEDGDQINSKNNLIFGNLCWKILRTTDTGGVKIIFTGSPSNNKCSGMSTPYDELYFSTTSNLMSPTQGGYMYSNIYRLNTSTKAFSSGFISGNDVSYENGQYTLINTSSYLNTTHHYTCLSSSNTCSTVYYAYFKVNSSSIYHEVAALSSGRSIKDEIDYFLDREDINTQNSNVKRTLENWYQSNLLNYNNEIEDTVFCSDRKIKSYGLFNKDGGIIDGFDSLLFNSDRDYNKLDCQNVTDKFSVNNPKAKLNYPIAIATTPEMNLLNNPYAIFKKAMWLLTPGQMLSTGVSNNYYDPYSKRISNYTVHSSDEAIYPVISLKPGIKYSAGDGSENSPYIIKNLKRSGIGKVVNLTTGNIDIVGGSSDRVEGSTVTFTALPNSGYTFSSVEVVDSNNNNIECRSTGNLNEYEFTMPDNHVNIRAYFDRIKYNINVQIVNETDDIIIDLMDTSQVESQSLVTFKVIPIHGFRIKDIRIIDSDNNNIDYEPTNIKNEYIFTMPASNVTIIPSYEQIASSITANSKEIIVEVNDATAVVYEDTVIFRVVPKDGYEVQSIEITDENNNKIKYTQTNNKNEYKFIMPDSNVTIKPIYKKIQSNVSKNPKTTYTITIICLLIVFSTISTLFYKYKKK